MSLSINNIETVKVLDPIVNIKQKNKYAILQGGEQVSYKQFTTNSFSNSSAQFTCNPPSPSIIVDRRVFVQVTYTINFTGVGNPLLVSPYDAPRAWPFANSCDTVQATINNTSVSINLNDVLSSMIKYNNLTSDKEGLFSGTPTYPDQSQNYNDLVNSNRNPLANYGDGIDGAVTPRGGFYLNSLTNGNNTASVSFTVVEPLLLSPFSYSERDEEGFIGIQTMSFNFTFNNNLASKIWSHAPALNSITSATANITDIRMLFKYITPLPTVRLPDSIEYNYFVTERYPTAVSAISPAGIYTIPTNNIQLNAIPSKIYVYCRISNGAQSAVCTTPDVFMPITSLSVNLGNRSSLLASASQFQLYNMSRANGLNVSYSQFTAANIPFNGLTLINGCGAPVCIDPVRDLGLPELSAPGLLETIQLQINVGVNFLTTTTQNQYSIYIVTVTNGLFNVIGQETKTQLGVFSRQDILDSAQAPFIDYYDIHDPMGGSFFSKLKSAFMKSANFAKKMLPYIKKGLPYAKKGLEYLKEYSPEVAELAATVGLGKNGRKMRGRALVGGSCGKHCKCDDCLDNMDDIQLEELEDIGSGMISRKQLLQRLKHMKDY